MTPRQAKALNALVTMDSEAVAFGVFASGAMRAGATLEHCRLQFGKLPVEDRARWLQRGRDTITYALGYVP
jgi:hypothetical protein